MRRLLTLLSKILAGYALTGFVIIPAAIHFAATQTATKFLSVPMHLGAVHFNPFTLRLSLHSIKLGERNDYIAGFSNLSVDLAWDSVTNKYLHIQSMELMAPFSKIVLYDNGSINLSSILKVTSQEPSTEKESSSSLQVVLDQLSIQQARASFLDQYIKLKSGTPFSATISELSIDGTNLGWPEMNGNLDISGQLNKGSSFSLQNSISLPAVAIASEVSLQDVDLTLAQPYLTPFTFAELKGGNLTTKANLNWSDKQGLRVDSELSVSQLNVKDERNQSSIVTWERLALTGVHYTQADNALSVANVSLAEPSIKIAIEKNLRINLSGLVKQGEQTTASSDASNSKPLRFDISKVSIQEGSVDFADRSFRPGFVTPIHDLNGQISSISSASTSPTSLTIKGQIDRYSPVTIDGKVDISAPLENSEIRMVFDSVELTTLTPYSGRFAGYNIHKGRMDLELFYRLKNNTLTAQNSMLLEHLTLGDKVDSDEAIDLPIKLAIALLKDREGRIDIKLPVTGDLENPEFELGPVIRMALINMLTNIISAPFDFLASLVGGDATEMQMVGFSPGSDDIALHREEALNKLVSALLDRPGMQLEVMGIATVKEDWPLVSKKLLDKAWNNEISKLGQPVAKEDLAEDEVVQLLSNIAKKLQIEIPTAVKPSEVRAHIIKNWPYDKGALRSLAIRRAKEIKNYLTEQGLRPERVFILDVQTPERNPAAENTITSRLELTAE